MSADLFLPWHKLMRQMIRRVQSDFLSTLETRYQIQIKVDVLKMLELRLRNGDAIVRRFYLVWRGVVLME